MREPREPLTDSIPIADGAPPVVTIRVVDIALKSINDFDKGLSPSLDIEMYGPVTKNEASEEKRLCRGRTRLRGAVLHIEEANLNVDLNYDNLSWLQKAKVALGSRATSEAMLYIRDDPPQP